MNSVILYIYNTSASLYEQCLFFRSPTLKILDRKDTTQTFGSGFYALKALLLFFPSFLSYHTNEE